MVCLKESCFVLESYWKCLMAGNMKWWKKKNLKCLFYFIIFFVRTSEVRSNISRTKSRKCLWVRIWTFHLQLGSSSRKLRADRAELCSLMIKPGGPLRADPDRRWLIDVQTRSALRKTKARSPDLTAWPRSDLQRTMTSLHVFSVCLISLMQSAPMLGFCGPRRVRLYIH